MVKFSVFGASALAAGALLAGAGAAAAPAYADSSSDSTFIRQLNAAGIPYISPDVAIGQATAVCLLLQQGHTDADALQWVQQTNMPANASSLQDARFAALAQSVYCPS
ncbi:MAG: DUF732 domain-containing protein [Mycobacterium sp.]